MLLKWKLILTNWINCYFNNTNKKDLPITLESLVDIISHLRENLNLDESKSSLLDAHTVQEFMVEKYPDFKFENGTVEPQTDGDVYLVASLLLFFVCVNSKNVNMKSAMCNRLSPGDQEIILKFSKHLMECSKITVTDVKAGISEACGQDIVPAESINLRVSVAETPPALRSLHNEVRRLQAALDAERFDRNYLQEELNRKNMKLEKLLKDKEQYKLEIVNLKSQISLCSAHERESQGVDVACNNISKIMKQLEQMEEKLLNTQELLEGAHKEIETYKIKLNQLKSEHEKLLSFSHQESARASDLAEELEIERRQTQSLQELVTELLQHNQLNKIDASLLECDDPDASVNFLQHNSSACNEVCANVIEVQLGEERAKIVALKQQIQILQDQLCEMTRKTEEEKDSLMEIISQKESTIMSLKHRVNEEIEEKNTLKTVFDDDVAKLNNELNELEQRLKGTQENSRNIIEKKMQEIQNLQEEKLSLLQSLSDETSKTENIIKRLQDDIDTEKSSKIRLRDEYDSHIMKLNEKVLNRNNELVELQNKILEKGEIIETLQLELRREKELRDELSNKYNNELIHLNSIREQVEQDLQQKSEEARDLHKHLQQHVAFIEQMNKDNDHLKATILQLQEDCGTLKDSKEKLLVEVKNRDVKAEQIYKETENLKNLLSEEKQKLQYNLQETSATVNALQSQLKNKIQLKVDELTKFKEDSQVKAEQIEKLTDENLELNKLLIEYKNDISILEEKNNEWKIKKDSMQVEFTDEILKLKKELIEKSEDNNKLQSLLQENQATVKTLNNRVTDLNKQHSDLDFEKNELITKLDEMKTKLDITEQVENEELSKMKHDNQNLLELLEVQKSEIVKLESLLMYEKQQNNLLQNDNDNEKLNLINKCSLLQENQFKAEQELKSRQKEIDLLTVKVKELSERSDNNLRDRDVLMDQLRQEKDALITKLSKELVIEREKWIKDSELQADTVDKLTKKLKEVTRCDTDTVKLLRKENEILKKTLVLKESFAAASQDKSNCKSVFQGVDVRDQSPQVDNTTVEHTQSSFESSKAISDLEKILQDRNRTIRSLQSDIVDLKSLIAESENKILDMSNDLEISKENCHQLSNQLKKIVHQKNEEIADLKKQLTKMSVTENRASQIIKVSAKYQTIILKRIAEIKSNTVLKELTNLGNTTNCDSDLRRGLNAGTITMEDLENFLDTTDRHLKRFSEKQLALQKERDRLAEVNKINESEIINITKFLTELSVSIKTFNSVKELYTQKLSRVVSLQRTVRREILGLEGQITDTTMCKLERGYAAVMQDLSECAMNLERWVERTIGRVISVEKIKNAFTTEERPSVSTTTIQNASLEVQLEELENSFCKLLEEIARAQKGEGAKDAQAVTVMEVRAEYEDKLNRMKAKMKQLYHEQIGIFKEKQREEIVSLEQELQKAREKLEESSRAYEDHIRSLTTELWNVGEKFLMKKDEAEWLRRKQRSGSLMSLQHVHSSGLVPTQEEPSRQSDTHSLRSLPVTSNTNNKNGRTLHMSDEEGEVFDNRCLRELATTPARAVNPRATRDAPPTHRLSELQWRNSLCPPHLKSSYPAETQFVSAIHEEDIKCVGGPSMSLGGRSQRKEVGITAYKKPGPPTPSKQAGRLSATDSELRESLRVEMEPNASRKTSTPSRIRALFRSAKGDNESTPRSRRLSNIFRKK